MMFSFKFWMGAEIFMHLDQGLGKNCKRKKQDRTKNPRKWLISSKAALDVFKGDGVLEPSEAGLDVHLRVTMSLKQGQHSNFGILWG